MNWSDGLDDPDGNARRARPVPQGAPTFNEIIEALKQIIPLDFNLRIQNLKQFLEEDPEAGAIGEESKILELANITSPPNFVCYFDLEDWKKVISVIETNLQVRWTRKSLTTVQESLSSKEISNMPTTIDDLLALLQSRNFTPAEIRAFFHRIYLQWFGHFLKPEIPVIQCFRQN